MRAARRYDGAVSFDRFRRCAGNGSPYLLFQHVRSAQDVYRPLHRRGRRGRQTRPARQEAGGDDGL